MAAGTASSHDEWKPYDLAWLQKKTARRAFSPSCVREVVRKIQEFARRRGCTPEEACRWSKFEYKPGIHADDEVRVQECQEHYDRKQHAKSKGQRFALKCDLLRVTFVGPAEDAGTPFKLKTWLEMYFRLLKCWGGYGGEMRRLVGKGVKLVVGEQEFDRSKESPEKFVRNKDSTEAVVRLSFSKTCILPEQDQLNAAINEFLVDAPHERAPKRTRDDVDDDFDADVARLPAFSRPEQAPSKRQCHSPALSDASTQARSAQESPSAGDDDDDDDDDWLELEHMPETMATPEPSPGPDSPMPDWSSPTQWPGAGASGLGPSATESGTPNSSHLPDLFHAPILPEEGSAGPLESPPRDSSPSPAMPIEPDHGLIHGTSASSSL
ncbi:hypothetical protein FNF28_03954 [Cafeteria roenbergensis]|uniref:Uncharacterized protein n=1 Tax=Cafeteria roenbergensis TaxID=33653 RepID=A0A5A8DJW8_CAFRO|nr:hypothetical protein FNF28_03954 [Cafeteria roenbergensis]